MKPERTVAIRHPDGSNRPTVIRASRYDPEKHTLWVEPTDAATVQLSDVPAEFPGAPDPLHDLGETDE